MLPRFLMSKLESINPTTGDTIKVYDAFSDDEVDEVLDASIDAFSEWRDVPMAQRAELMHKAADVLREGVQEFAELLTTEMGKTIGSARAEVQKCAWVCDFYADRAADMLAPRLIDTDATLSMVRYDPLGPLLAVMPWNFPFWQVFRFAAPYLMGGNTGLLKHSANTQGSALAIEQIFERAGFPPNVFRTLVVESGAIEAIIKDKRVRGVTLTGSERAGRAVAKAAGEALKPSVLELGGSDPFIVLEDADLDEAVKGAIKGRLMNNGQSCIAAKRFIIVDAVHDAFVDKYKAAMESQRMGDPMDEETDIGPQAREDLRDDLHDQVTRSIKAGAKLVTGGEIPDGPGFFYPPTMLTHVEPGIPAFDEEVFGPVAAVIRARDEAHAIELANTSSLGLGASLWTHDMKRALHLAPRIESGHVAVNGIVKSDPRLPFGGIKDSGYGRELSDEGIKEFMNAKTIWIK
jgi:succinate-semialdehyde dehydrogenase/glutarate-semialdehyde dehydrogenase